MQDFEKTKEQLIDELAGLRSRVALLEARDNEGEEGGRGLWGSGGKLSAVFESIYEAIVVTDLEYRVVELNDVTVNVSGYSKDDIVGQEVFKFFAEEERSRARRCFQDVLADGGKRPSRFEFTVVNAGGLRIPVEASVAVMRDGSGAPTGFVSTIRDVIKRKQTEEALRHSEEKLRAMFESMNDGVVLSDINFNIVDVNSAMLQMSGYKKSDVIGKSGLELLKIKDRERALENITGLKVRGSYMDIAEYAILLPDGGELSLEVRTSGLYDSNGKITGFINVLRDISERKRAEEALRHSEEKLRMMFEAMTDGVIVTDAQLNVVDVNSATVQKSGYAKEALIGKNTLALLKLSDREKAADQLKEVLESGRVQDKHEYTILRPDYAEMGIEVATSALRDSSGELSGFLHVVRDVTERNRMIEALRQSEERYRLLFESAIDGKAVVDVATQRVLLANETALKIYGFNSKVELEGLDIFNFIHPDDRERVVAAAQRGAMFKDGVRSLEEVRTFSKGGDEKWILAAGTLSEYEGRPAGLVSFVDITERKKAEEALRKSEEKYRDLVEQERDVIFSVDALGFITSINSAVRGWGYKSEELIGKNFIELVPEAEKEKTAIELHSRLLGAGEITAETAIVTKSGVAMPIEYSAVVIREGGQYAGARGIVRDVSERKRAEEALRQSEEKLRVLFEALPDGLSVVDLNDGRLIDANPAALRLFGFSREESIGRNVYDFIAPEDRERAIADLPNTLKTGIAATSEWRLLNKKGEVVACEATVAVIRDGAGTPVLLVDVIRDVTERRRVENELTEYRNNLEKMVQERTSELITANIELQHEIAERQRVEVGLKESEEKHRALLDDMREGYLVVGDNKVLFANKRCAEVLGMSPEVLIGKDFWDFIAPKDQQQAGQISEALGSGGGSDQLWDFVRPMGVAKDVLLEVSVRPITYEGDPAFAVVLRDVTERHRIEEALKASEEKLRLIFDSIGEGLVITDLEGNVLELNGDALRMVGYDKKEEVLGRSCLEPIVEADRARAVQDMMRMLEMGDCAPNEYRFMDRHGREFYGELRGAVLRDSNGEPSELLGVFRDISERHRIEEALKASEEKLRGIFNSIQDGVAVTNLDFSIIEANEAAVGMSGYRTREELIGHSGFELISPEDLVKVMPTSEEALKGHPIPRGEYRVINALGEEMYAEVGVTMYYDASGNKAGFVAVIKDITEHKRIEDALRDSEEKLRIMFSSMADGVVVTDVEGRIVDINAAQLRMFGYNDKKDILGRIGFDFIAERDRDRAFKDIIRVYKEGYNIGVAYTVVNNTGKEFDAELSTALLHDAEGKPTGLITVMRDITARRRMEQAIRDSEEKLRILFESIGDGIIVTDLEGIIIDCNGTAARLGGWENKTQLFGMSGFDFVVEKDRPRMVADFVRAIHERRNITLEYTIKGRDGQEYDCEVIVSLLRDISGIPVGIVNVIRDMTERKRMEQALRDSEEMARGMLESAATAVCIEQNGNFQYVSPLFAEMTGYSVDELIGTVSVSYIYEADREKATREAIANLKGESNLPHEYRLVRKDGSIMWILEKVASIQYKGQRAAIGNLLDITRLKDVETALRDSEEKLRVMFASMADGVLVTDMDGNVIEGNEACVRMSGYSTKDEVIGRNGFDFIAERDRAKAIYDIEKIFEHEFSPPMEYKMVNKDGVEYDGEIIAALMRDGTGKPQGFITVVRDVSERKRADEKLRESQEMMRGMLESAATGIYLVQTKKFEYVSPLFAEISGYTDEELLGTDPLKYVHPDDKETARTKAVENLKGLSSLPHEFRFIRKDGNPVWILEKVASIEYKGSRAAIGSFMDITEMKQMEVKLRQRSKELEQRTNQLLALQKITTSIQRTLELKEVLQHVADGVVFNLGFDHALILLLDEKKGVVRGTVFSTREDFRTVEKVEALLTQRLTEVEVSQKKGYSRAVDAAVEGKATITHSLYEMADPILTREESAAVQKALKVKTFINMPLFARGRHVGSILTCSRHEDVKVVALEPLRILSDQAGVAIENANLYQGMSELAQRLAVIHALSKILGSSLDIRGVYKAFIDEIKKVMDFDRVSIAMVEGDKLRYFIVAEDVDTELKDGDALPLKDSATWMVLQTKQTIIEPDFDKEMKFPIDQIYRESGLRSAIRVPLFSKGEVFATFNLASRRPNVYGDREREILEQIAGPLTAAIENSRLFNRVKGHEAELEKAYADLKKAQGFMVQSEKLRALGEMAGGVAHDFNNILAVVLGRAQLALEDVKDEKLKKDLQIIEQTSLDAAKTVRRLQDFARVRVERNFELLDLKDVIENALQMVETRRAKSKEREGVNVEIESKLTAVAPIEGDAAELREGLLNIIFNAMDAMPEGGKIVVETKQDKKWVTISISDTGIGMPEAVKDKLFEPFFTTKKHKGTGLGLSVTYGIVKRHRGEISFKSKVGAGTTFYIKLPASSGEVKKGAVVASAAGVASASILIVDDNPEVVGILGLTLKNLGHKVVEASSGEAAINTFELGKFDLVITDLGMPDMSGHEVAKIVKEIKPGTPVLVISGWGGQLNLKEMPEVDGVIAKPFSKDVLSKKISELLSKKVAEPKPAAPDASVDEKGSAVVPVAGDEKHVGKRDSKIWKAGKGAHSKKKTKAVGGSHAKKSEKPIKKAKPKGGKKGK